MEIKEEWKKILNYENFYEISNLGKIKNLKNNKILKNRLQTKGYLIISLYKDKKIKNYLLHRLLAIYFINNPNNLEIINHIDGNKLNNCLDNLEWVSVRENTSHWRLNQNNKKYI